MRRPTALAAALFLAGSLVACGSDDDGEEDAGTGGDAFTRVVQAADFSFDPTEIEVESGRAVTLQIDNSGEVLHNLNIADLEVDVDAGPGESGRARITPEPGTYTFQCKYHPSRMQGTLTVT
ncbi:MAG TPA: cupredoxin domain-containing protein [Acidimicrobiales bacterium]|jgi:plastocyanin|nr:cupredoxin domain-containing protein [Acidimicrobiales bacterium]